MLVPAAYCFGGRLKSALGTNRKMEEQMSEQRLFISHAAVDRDLAAFLEETARVAIPGIQVFRASRVGQIRAGREWFDVVTRELREADQYMVLLTEASISKPWISFETGAAWYTERPLVPVLAPDFNPQDVPEPLRFLQLLSLGDPKQAQEAFKELGGELSDPDTFVSQASQIAQRSQRRALEDAGWKGIEFRDSYYAYDGPLEKLPEGDPVPMPEDLPQAFDQKGFESVLGIPGRLDNQFSVGFKRVWLVRNWQRKHPLLSSKEKQQLCVRSKKRHHQ